MEEQSECIPLWKTLLVCLLANLNSSEVVMSVCRQECPTHTFGAAPVVLSDRNVRPTRLVLSGESVRPTDSKAALATFVGGTFHVLLVGAPGDRFVRAP